MDLAIGGASMYMGFLHPRVLFAVFSLIILAVLFALVFSLLCKMALEHNHSPGFWFKGNYILAGFSAAYNSWVTIWRANVCEVISCQRQPANSSWKISNKPSIKSSTYKPSLKTAPTLQRSAGCNAN
ncbi:hypothetical protein [Desulfoscipio gibsoniae]|uniref:hypothetical protein n=1 Tax=Desulfoscipio gibsoniae TaxID=102134 RepID=UPI000698A80A|nr:hypothetical protein [Desulfoscipio gibsoniae]